MQQAINSNQDLQIAPVCIVYKLNIFLIPIYQCFTPLLLRYSDNMIIEVKCHDHPDISPGYYFAYNTFRLYLKRL